MTKKKLLKAMDHAYEYHMEQIEKVGLLIEGKRVTNPTPRQKNECEFGKWLYGDASHMKKLLGLQFYNQMLLIHEYWHIEYEKIYDIYYSNEEDSVWTKVFGSRGSVAAEKREHVAEFYKQLQHATDDLLEVLLASKRRIIALKERNFENNI